MTRATWISVLALLTSLFAIGSASASFPGSNGKLVYSSDCSVYTANADGSGRQTLTTPPYRACDGFDGGAELSRDGMRAAFSRVTTTPAGISQNDIYVVDLGTRTVTQITSTPDVREINPTWASDGERLAFIARSRILGDESYGSLHTINIRTGAQQQLTNALDAAPDWSPDGRRIAFARNTLNGIVLMTRDVAAGSESSLHAGGAADPDWSPDGTRVVFQDTSGPAKGSNDGIWTVYADPSNPRPKRLIAGTLSANADTTTPYTPFWSPDGTRIGFTRGGISGLRRDVRQINADGSNERVLFKTEALWLKDPDWQPVRQLFGGLVGNLCITLCSEITSLLSLSTTLGILPITRLLFEDPTDAAEDPEEAVEDVVEAVDDTVNNVGFPNVLPNQRIIYRTVVRLADGRLVPRQTESTVGRREAIDVDYDRRPDVIAGTTPVANLSAIRLCVTRVSTTLDPCELPLPGTGLVPVDLPAKKMSVEVLFSTALSETGSVPDPTHVAFGYDALASLAPRLFDATLGKSGESRFDSHVVTAGAASPMSLIADVQTTGVKERANQARLTFENPVPSTVDLALDTGEREDPQPDEPLRIEARLAQASRMTAHVEDAPRGESSHTIDTTLANVPATTTPGVLLTRASVAVGFQAEDQRLALDAGAVIPEARFSYVGSFGRQRYRAVARDLPISADLDLDVADGVVSVDYDASSELRELTLEVEDDDGLAGRARELHALARQLPAHLDIRLGDPNNEQIDANGGRVGLVEAHLIDATSDEATSRLPAGTDGVVLRDTPTTFAIFARATNLRRLQLARAATAGDCDARGYDLCATIDKTAPSPLWIDLQAPAVGYLVGSLNQLQAGQTTLWFVAASDADPRTRVFLNGPPNADTSSLSLNTNAANSVRNLHIDLSPLPATMSVCQSGELACGPDRSALNQREQALDQPVVSVDFMARDQNQQPTPVRMNVQIDEWSAGDYTSIRGLTMSRLVFQAATDDGDSNCGAAPLFFYADTDNLPVKGAGEVVSTCGGSEGEELNQSTVTFTLPEGNPTTGNTVHAQDRLIITDFTGTVGGVFNGSYEEGTMHCPGGTEITLVDAGFADTDVNMQEDLCTSGAGDS